MEYITEESNSEADIGILFYSYKIAQVLTQTDEIQFDGTVYTVPIQFFQLLTIFARIGRHVIPCIHCLLTSKKETLHRTTV